MRRLLFLTLGVIGFSVILIGNGNAQTGRKSVSGAEVTGSFERGFREKVVGGKAKFVEGSNTIDIAALGGNKLKVYMNLMHPYEWGSGEQSAHLGDLMGEFVIEGNTATYTGGWQNQCKMTIKFVRSGTIKVTQTGSDADCEFGHNVRATGTYKKVSSKKPKFGEN
jgi:hypothetical protein